MCSVATLVAKGVRGQHDGQLAVWRMKAKALAKKPVTVNASATVTVDFILRQ